MTYTNFNDYSHAELRKMAQALNPGEVMAAGDPWRRAADTLKAIRATLTRASTEAAVSWEGTTSDAFHTRMLNLAATINNAASYANDAANTLKAMSEAIAKAKHDMPEEPSGWDQVKDGIGDTVSSLFGDDDEDSRTAIAEQRKLEAAAVMQTLAMHYRVATPMLKPPPPYQPLGKLGDNRDIGPQDDSSGSAAVASAMMAGTGLGGPTMTPTQVGEQQAQPRRTSEPPLVKRPVSAAPPAPTDAGIKGGTAQTLPKPPGTTNYGPGVGIDAAVVNAPNNATSNNVVTAGTQSSGGNPGSAPGGLPRPTGAVPGGGPSVDPGGTTTGAKSASGSVQGKGAALGKDPMGRPSVAEKSVNRSGRAVGAGEVFGSGSGSGAGGRGAGATTGGSRTPGRTGGVIGEGGRSSTGGGGRYAFTEGGSGLGARARAKADLGVGGTSGVAPGVPVGEARQRKKNEEKSAKRPDYLVEDEETWASDKPTNPNVVE
ncbi:hypothetical protein [Kitasatospora sp. NPDC005751]|uniref:WXG100 family type VII secretion target n=1 Tax=Kitasatospora sp. NPDC005751 TaxID=3157064 RepID=UPI0033C5E501